MDYNLGVLDLWNSHQNMLRNEQDPEKLNSYDFVQSFLILFFQYHLYLWTNKLKNVNTVCMYRNMKEGNISSLIQTTCYGYDRNMYGIPMNYYWNTLCIRYYVNTTVRLFNGLRIQHIQMWFEIHGVMSCQVKISSPIHSEATVIHLIHLMLRNRMPPYATIYLPPRDWLSL